MDDDTKIVTLQPENHFDLSPGTGASQLKPGSFSIHVGSVLDVLPTLEAGSVQCVITSPPYWGLRDYGTAEWEGGDAECTHRVGGQVPDSKAPGAIVSGVRPGVDASKCIICGARRIDSQIGLEPTFDAYLENMVEVFRQVRRVLRDDGTLWVNLGSSYASSNTQPSRPRGGAPACDSDDRGLQGSFDAGHACPCCGGELRGGSLIRRDRSDCTDQPDGRSEQPSGMTDRDSGHSDQADAATSSPDVPSSTTSSCTPSVPAASSRASGTLDQQASQTTAGGASSSGRMASHNHGSTSTEQPSAGRTLGRELSCVACGYSTTTPLRFKPKDLIPQPWLIALALQQDGWYLRSDIIWSKANPMPESVTDRPTSSHEYVFLLSKQPRYFFDAGAVREAASDWGSRDRTETKNSNPDNGTAPDSWLTNGDRSAAGRNLRTVWSIPTQPFPEAHFATFPEKLVEPCIKAGTSEKGCCPECGKAWERVVERDISECETEWSTVRDIQNPAQIAAYLRHHRERAGLSRRDVDEHMGTVTLYSWFEGRPAGTETPTVEQWAKLKAILNLDDTHDADVSRTKQIQVTNRKPRRADMVAPSENNTLPMIKTLGFRPACECYDPDSEHVKTSGMWYVAKYAPQPCTVLDPFSGSGTTGVVACQLGRNYIGIELNESYAAMSRRRIGKALRPSTYRDENHIEDAPLFDGAGGDS